MIILFYLLSFIGICVGGFHFSKYCERSHLRERSRRYGNYINKYLKSNMFDLMCEYLLQQLLIISDMLNGFLEGIIGLEPMVELFVPEPPKEVIKYVPVDKIVEKIVEKVVEKPIEIPINVYNEEQIISELKRMFNPDIKMLTYVEPIIQKNDKIGGSDINFDTLNETTVGSDTLLLKNVENIFIKNELDKPNVKPKFKTKIVKKNKEIDTESNKFYDDTENMTTEKSKLVNTKITKNGKKIKVSFNRK